MYFVYISNNGKIFPQKWEDEKFNSETGKPREYVKKFKLDDKHKSMRLNELMFTFPLEEQK